MTPARITHVMVTDMQIDALDYPLPVERIATQPAEPRDSARLMVVNRQTGEISHLSVTDLGRGGWFLRAGDLMVFNQTRVLPARFVAVRTATGGKIAGLYLETLDQDQSLWRVLLESRGRLRRGEKIAFDDCTGSAYLELLETEQAGSWQARLHGPLSTDDLLARIGSTPLPPYIRQARKARGENPDDPRDAGRYNTVFSADPGSVAAPTAALHFTRPLLEAIDRLGVRRVSLTLQIGLGTFAPVRADTLEDHRMHTEQIRIPSGTIDVVRRTRDAGGRIIPVGTTCVRALESLREPVPTGDFVATTGLFIKPGGAADGGFRFRFTDGLMTNFHLPRSTLLALVAALPGVGIERLKHWYRIAIKHGYRFYSYGDAMLLV